jgi:hypothetical protein
MFPGLAGKQPPTRSLAQKNLLLHALLNETSTRSSSSPNSWTHVGLEYLDIVYDFSETGILPLTYTRQYLKKRSEISTLCAATLALGFSALPHTSALTRSAPEHALDVTLFPTKTKRFLPHAIALPTPKNCSALVPHEAHLKTASKSCQFQQGRRFSCVCRRI